MAFVTVQVLAVIFSLFALTRAFFRYKDHKITGAEFGLWSCVWLALIVGALSPDTSRLFATLLGIRRPVDALVYAGIIVLFYMVFRLYVMAEATNHEVTRVVRALAVTNPRRKR